MELTQQIATFLSDNGIGLFDPNGLTGNIFINALPDKPDQSIAIYTQGGPSDDQSGEYALHAIQVLIRSSVNDPRPGETNAQKVIDLLKGYNSNVFITGGNWVFDVTAQQDAPSNIGPDQSGRFEFSQNFIIEILK